METGRWNAAAFLPGVTVRAGLSVVLKEMEEQSQATV